MVWPRDHPNGCEESSSPRVRVQVARPVQLAGRPIISSLRGALSSSSPSGPALPQWATLVRRQQEGWVTGKVSRSGDGLEITWENGGKDRNLSLPGDLYGVDQLGGWGVVVEEEQKAGGRVSPPLGPQAAYAMSEQACAGAASAGSSGKEEKHESKVEEVPHPEEERALLHRLCVELLDSARCGAPSNSPEPRKRKMPKIAEVSSSEGARRGNNGGADNGESALMCDETESDALLCDETEDDNSVSDEPAASPSAHGVDAVQSKGKSVRERAVLQHFSSILRHMAQEAANVLARSTESPL